jgi:hypothetical protein
MEKNTLLSAGLTALMVTLSQCRRSTSPTASSFVMKQTDVLLLVGDLAIVI